MFRYDLITRPKGTGPTLWRQLMHPFSILTHIPLFNLINKKRDQTFKSNLFHFNDFNQRSEISDFCSIGVI